MKRLLLILAILLLAASGPWDSGASAQVSWSNTRTGQSNTASNTANWSASVPVLSGLNPIDVTATDTSGNASSDHIDITYVPTFPGNSLVAAYGFEETSGSIAVDSNPFCVQCNNGTLVNGATRVPGGKFGQGIQLLSGSFQYVSVNSSNSLGFTQSFTLSAWVSASVVDANYRAIMSKGSNANSGGPNHPYELFATLGSEGTCTGGSAGYMQVNGSLPGPYTFEACTATTLQPNQFTHLA